MSHINWNDYAFPMFVEIVDDSWTAKHKAGDKILAIRYFNSGGHEYLQVKDSQLSLNMDAARFKPAGLKKQILPSATKKPLTELIEKVEKLEKLMSNAGGLIYLDHVPANCNSTYIFAHQMNPNKRSVRTEQPIAVAVDSNTYDGSCIDAAETAELIRFLMTDGVTLLIDMMDYIIAKQDSK